MILKLEANKAVQIRNIVFIGKYFRGLSRSQSFAILTKNGRGGAAEDYRGNALDIAGKTPDTRR